MCHIFSTHFSILFGLHSWITQPARLSFSQTARPSVHLSSTNLHLKKRQRQLSLPSCVFRSCYGETDAFADQSWCLPRASLQLSLQEVTRLRRTHPWIEFPGCGEEAAGVWGSSLLVLTLNVSLESWYRWAPRSPSTVPLSRLLSAASWLESTSYLLTNVIFLCKLD